MGKDMRSTSTLVHLFAIGGRQKRGEKVGYAFLFGEKLDLAKELYLPYIYIIP